MSNETKTKVCNICEIEQDATLFLANRLQCKTCRKKKWQEKKKAIHKEKAKKIYECDICGEKKNKDKMAYRVKGVKKCYTRCNDCYDNNIKTGNKLCTICKQTKSISAFRTKSAQCRDCVNEKRRNERMKIRREKGDIAEKEEHKICRGCKKELPNSYFRKNRRKCIDCERNHGRKYRQSDVGKDNAQVWNNENKEKMKTLQADWYQKNKPKIRKTYNKRYHSDVEFKYNRTVRNKMLNMLKKRKDKKGDLTKFNKDLQCTGEEYVSWLEHCFPSEKYTINNHGILWHVDHVIPVNKFKLFDKEGSKNMEEIELCFGWFNTMPILGGDNMSKHDKIDKKQLRKHLLNLEAFGFKENEYYKKYNTLCATYLDAGNP